MITKICQIIQILTFLKKRIDESSKSNRHICFNIWCNDIRNRLVMIEIHTKEFHCDGPEGGEHPRVYYTMDADNTKTCMYCNETYKYVEKNERI